MLVRHGERHSRGQALFFRVLYNVHKLFLRFCSNKDHKCTLAQNLLAGARSRARCFDGRLVVCLHRCGCAAAASAMLRRPRRRRRMVSRGWLALKRLAAL